MLVTNLLEESHHSSFVLKDALSKDIYEGLSAPNKAIPSKYMYDDEGSRLFKRITQLDAYYPTRIEKGIMHLLERVLPHKLQLKELDVVELGVGDGHKSAHLIKGFGDFGTDLTYYPIDISAEAFELLQNDAPQYNRCKVNGVVADYLQGTDYTHAKSSRRKLVLFLGSNIGNFSMAEANEFLLALTKRLHAGDYLLIGFDLLKDLTMLQRAYDDEEGVTRKFNLNLLRRLNRELGANFDLNAFKHLALYNPNHYAMESYLLSLKEQSVRIRDLDISIDFDYYEPIHIEYSFKYTTNIIHKLCKQSGCELIENYTDENQHFIDSLWQVT